MASIRIESRIIEWAMTDSERTISFNTVFEDIPVVCVMPQVYSVSSGHPGGDVNTYIAQVSKTSVVVGTSGIFSGSIHLQAVDKTW
tara:strand:- start:787 stop:1044 length:258 start_codon:yes stop_codon:yes gene_type:complete